MSNSDEVDQFLQRMRTMSEQRDQQDAARVKKLEEELIQGRSERLARRAGMPSCFPLRLYAYMYHLVLTAQNAPARSPPTNPRPHNRYARSSIDR
jgi:hypothetical protein